MLQVVLLSLLTLTLSEMSATRGPMVQAFPDPAPAATIPAFPEQSAAAETGRGRCRFDLSGELIISLAEACSPRRSRPASRARCCPSLAASLYSAFSSTILSAALSEASSDLPALPDDSEPCASAAERAIAARGVKLPRVNSTCGAAYCYCGIRLRPLTCAWTESGAWARRLQRDCARTGLAGCSLCLRALHQLGDSASISLNGGKSVMSHGNDCQLMGLTWLLSKNLTRYLPSAIAILRSFAAEDAETSSAATGDGEMGPTCRLSRREMPIAVGSSKIDGEPSASATPPPTLMYLLMAFVQAALFLLCR